MFFSDKPIVSQKEDSLGRSGFASLLAEGILNLKERGTFTIGLYGKWGSGKTSIINMMIEEIQNKLYGVNENKLTIIRFAPWNFWNENQLTEQFFVRLSNELRSKKDKQLTEIGKAFEKYSTTLELAQLIPEMGKVAALIQRLLGFLGGWLNKDLDKEDILKQKDQIINLLKNQSSRILIVLDDIDRLNDEQVRQVFQLIASVANFPNIVYLLAFDKSIVLKALESIQKGDGEKYLEKIVQIPINVPDINTRKLEEVTREKLNDILYMYRRVGNELFHLEHVLDLCVYPFVSNMRDVNRLCNSVQFKLATMCNEVNFADMVGISSIEVFYPDVYEWIKNNKSCLTGEFDLSNILENLSSTEAYQKYLSLIASMINANESVDSKGKAEQILQAICCIFPCFGERVAKLFERYDQEKLRRNNRIGHPEKFDRYFHLDINYIGLKKEDILNVANKFGKQRLNKFFLESWRNGTFSELLHEIKSRVEVISSSRVILIIISLMEFWKQLTNLSSEDDDTLKTRCEIDYLVVALLQSIPKEDILELFCNTIFDKKYDLFSPAVSVLYILEKDYNRSFYASKGRKLLLDNDGYCKLEMAFKQRIEELLSDQSLFELEEWKKICLLLESIDATYIKNYLDDTFNNEDDILKYLSGYVSSSKGYEAGYYGTEYEILKGYEQYLTQDRIIQTIESKKESGDLFSMPNEIQYKCGAIYLFLSEQIETNKLITQARVDGLINNWKTSCEQ